tara:strand:+ start:401 stop:772 length:372 start_codon:yes stop_codon:yes gene_type:complete
MSKIILLALGWICVGLGFIGIFVPGLPTTIFLIIALWAFTKSSKRLRNWLLNHKRFGPILRNWQEHRVVPLKAKILMVILQISVVIIVQYTFDNLIISFGLATILLLVATYVLSLPSKVTETH